MPIRHVSYDADRTKSRRLRYTVAPNQATRDRVWQVDSDPFDIEDADNLRAALDEAALVLSRIGGAVIVVADREEVAPDMWATTRFVFRWSSYSPGRRKGGERQMDIAPEPVTEPDATAA